MSNITNQRAGPLRQRQEEETPLRGENGNQSLTQSMRRNISISTRRDDEGIMSSDFLAQIEALSCDEEQAHEIIRKIRSYIVALDLPLNPPRSPESIENLEDNIDVAAKPLHESLNLASTMENEVTSDISNSVSIEQELYVEEDDCEAPPLPPRFTASLEDDQDIIELHCHVEENDCGALPLSTMENEVTSDISNSVSIEQELYVEEDDCEAPALRPRFTASLEDDQDIIELHRHVEENDCEALPLSTMENEVTSDVSNTVSIDQGVEEDDCDAPPLPPRFTASLEDDQDIKGLRLHVEENDCEALPLPTRNGSNGSVQLIRRILPESFAHGAGDFLETVRNVFYAAVDNAEPLVSATLVEEDEVIIAEPIGFYERKWKQIIAFSTCFLMTLFAGLLSLNLTGIINVQGKEDLSSETLEPSSSPIFDPRTTLEIVQERGYVRCGMLNGTISSGEGFHLDLCRSAAAVVVGNPDGFQGVPATTVNRWNLLHERRIDLLLTGDTHTIEREIREHSTGAGFSFSSPYIYDGMVYFGKRTFVRCAEQNKRYDVCSDLLICVLEASTHHDFMKRTFPSDYFKVVPTQDELIATLFNETCNVLAEDKSFIQTNKLFDDGIRNERFIVGYKMMTEEPLAMVTRNTDREFSDIINWVLQALIFGEEQGLTKDLTRCHNYTDLPLHDVSKLNLMNAVYCVGNYGESIDGWDNNRGRNQINNGTGMLYPIPFGDLSKGEVVELATDGMLSKIRTRETVNCGVAIPDSFGGNITGSDKIVGMGVDYCRAMAAALFQGNSDHVKFTTFPETENSSFIALANGTIDVLVGGRIQRKYDFESPLTLEGFHFSTPYYYGNESAKDDASLYSIATREDDAMFSSFVNCLVIATIHAQENEIHREKSGEIPLVFVFGRELNWALKDAIAYSGSYDEIYSRNFGSYVPYLPGGGSTNGQTIQQNINSGFDVSKRGRNTLNDGGPLLHSFPHLP